MQQLGHYCPESCADSPDRFLNVSFFLFRHCWKRSQEFAWRTIGSGQNKEKSMASKLAMRPKSPAPQSASMPQVNEADHSAIQESIRLLAYKKWEAAGKPEGDGCLYWLDAERELRQNN
jgi:hypothetical protein